MRWLLLLGVSFTLLAINGAMDSWPSNDDSLFSDSDWALDSPALPSDDLALVPLDQDNSPPLFDTDLPSVNSETDLSESIPWAFNDDPTLSPSSSFDDLSLADSFQLADCSASSENLPLFSKSRIRRNDSPGVCEPNPDGTSSDGLEGLDLGRIQRELDVRLNPVETMKGTLNDEHNEFCTLLTVGALPWGVCSSGNPADELLVVTDPITVKGNPQSLAYKLSHCTLCTSLIGHSSSELFFFLTSDSPTIPIPRCGSRHAC